MIIKEVLNIHFSILNLPFSSAPGGRHRSMHLSVAVRAELVTELASPWASPMLLLTTPCVTRNIAIAESVAMAATCGTGTGTCRCRSFD